MPPRRTRPPRSRAFASSDSRHGNRERHDRGDAHSRHRTVMRVGSSANSCAGAARSWSRTCVAGAAVGERRRVHREPRPSARRRARPRRTGAWARGGDRPPAPSPARSIVSRSPSRPSDHESARRRRTRSTASSPNTVNRGVRFAAAAKPLSIATVAPCRGRATRSDRPRRCTRGARRRRRAVRARRCAGRRRRATPRRRRGTAGRSTACDAHAPTHPPPSSRSNSQPHGRNGTREPAERCTDCDVLARCRPCRRAPSRAAVAACGRVAELEVAERERARGARFGLELGGFVGVERERLVAHDGLARRERGAHVRRVQERRRVHAHEIDVARGATSARTASRRAPTRRRRPRSLRSPRTPARRTPARSR